MSHPSSPHAPADVQQSVPAHFGLQVARYADRPALSVGGRLWTYHRLDRWTDRVAAKVQGLLGGPPEPVAILASDRATAVACALAVLKAGKIVLHLDPAVPSARLLTLMEVGGARLLVGGGGPPSPIRSLAAEARLPFLDLDALGEAEADSLPSDFRPALHSRPGDPAAVLLTSGSTGHPKAVAYSHQNILAICLMNAHLDHLSATDRRLLIAAPGTSMGLGAFDALLNGAALFTFDFVEAGLTGLRRLLEVEEITVLHTVPAIFRALVRSLRQEDRFPHLRLIRLGGDAVRRADVEVFRRSFHGPCVLRVGYASTEAGLIASRSYDVATPLAEADDTVGFPIDGVEVRILDGSGGEVAVGDAGEIAVRSRFLPGGYWRRPDLTGERLVPDPGGGKGRFWRTGDCGRVLPDGRVEVLGRTDLQLKIRGRLIELPEVEAALRALPRVVEAAVAVHLGPSAEERLVGYLVWNGPPLAPGEMQAALGSTLPDYQIPSAFVTLPRLPLTAAGKIDRRSLPSPRPEGVGVGKDFVGPCDEVELLLTGLWERLLGVRPIDVRHDFFDLGGDSLLAAELVSEIQRQTGCHLPLSLFVRHSSVERLAGRLRAPERPSRTCLVPLRIAGSGKPFFLAHTLGGELLLYRELVARLKTDHPVFGLRRDRLEGERPRYTRVEDMAAQYVDDIRALQPHGPYRLGGLSFGAVIAFEMAYQLHEAGERVGSLIMLDPGTPGVGTAEPASSGARCRAVIQRARFHVDALRILRPEERVAYLRGLGAPHSGLGSETEDRDIVGVLTERLPAEIRHNIDPYTPRVYPGRATLFLAQLQSADRDRCRYWRPFLAQGMDVRVVPGAHSFIVKEPFVRVLAPQLEECLRLSAAD